MCNLPHPLPPLPPLPPPFTWRPPPMCVGRNIQEDHIYPSIICHFSPPQRIEIEKWRWWKSRPDSNIDRETTLTLPWQGQIFSSIKHKTAHHIFRYFTFKSGKKVHFGILILNVWAFSWNEFGWPTYNWNGMKILFLFKLFLKIKVWQQLARSRFPVHCLFVLEFIFSCNLRLRPDLTVGVRPLTSHNKLTDLCSEVPQLGPAINSSYSLYFSQLKSGLFGHFWRSLDSGLRKGKASKAPY